MFIIVSFKMSKIKTGIELNAGFFTVPDLLDGQLCVTYNDGFQDGAQGQKEEAAPSVDHERVRDGDARGSFWEVLSGRDRGPSWCVCVSHIFYIL